MSNTMTLFPYQIGESKTWVFDDPATELKEEAFVSGMSEMITRMVEVKRIPNPNKGIAVTFGFEPFEGADAVLHWIQEGQVTFKVEGEDDHTVLLGNWYGGKVAGETMVGWLCPALLKYFQVPPKTLYAGVSTLPEGVDPIWHDAPKKEAFVSPYDEVVITFAHK